MEITKETLVVSLGLTSFLIFRRLKTKTEKEMSTLTINFEYDETFEICPNEIIRFMKRDLHSLTGYEIQNITIKWDKQSNLCEYCGMVVSKKRFTEHISTEH